MPLRIDTYNHCQFDCAYCFAKTRGGKRGASKFSVAPIHAIRSRFERVARGEINSALDEFIARRIPFQLGGMADPFTAAEEKLEITNDLLILLAEYDYPTVINTKNARAFDAETTSILQRGNFYIRFSVSMLDLKVRSLFETSTSSFNEILKTSAKLQAKKIPVSIRYQPIFPGTEEQYLRSLKSLASVGIKYVSLEYLKVPIDVPRSDLRRLNQVYAIGIYDKFKELGAKRLGRELVLPISKKVAFFKEFKSEAGKLGIGVGLADNEFLHLSDGGACCGGADMFLKRANYFDGNIQGILHRKQSGSVIQFSDLKDRWMPKLNIGTYLNSKSRMANTAGEWLEYLKRDWNGGAGIYSPSFFYGVSETGKTDRLGFKIYRVQDWF